MQSRVEDLTAIVDEGRRRLDGPAHAWRANAQPSDRYGVEMSTRNAVSPCSQELSFDSRTVVRQEPSATVTTRSNALSFDSVRAFRKRERTFCDERRETPDEAKSTWHVRRVTDDRKEIDMRSTLSLMVLLTAAGCAGAPPPQAEVASAAAAVRGAEEAGAHQFPQAELHLKLANEQVQHARALMEDEKNERARAIAVRAYQDAELAIAIARTAQSEQQLQTFVAHHPSVQSAEPSAGGENPNPAASSPSEQTSVQ